MTVFEPALGALFPKSFSSFSRLLVSPLEKGHAPVTNANMGSIALAAA